MIVIHDWLLAFQKLNQNDVQEAAAVLCVILEHIRQLKVVNFV
jgi:hypothetical protein